MCNWSIFTNYRNHSMKQILIGIFLLLSVAAESQQIPVIDHYFTNPYLINPAKAGMNEFTNIFLINRQQWTEFQGSPKYTRISADASFNDKKVGLGLIFSNDADNIFKRNAFYGTYAYHLKINEDHNISMGLNLGLIDTHISLSDLQTNDVNDPLVFSQNGTRVKPDATAGINYRYKKLEIGAAGYQLMGSKFRYYDQTTNQNLNYQLIQHFLFVANYSFTAIPDKLDISPNIMARTTLGLPSQLDAGINFDYENFLWSYIGYRQNSCVYFNLGGRIYDNLTISGTYELNTGNLAGISGPSYEILLGFRFGKKSSVTSEIYFSNNHITEEARRNSQIQSENIDKIKYENTILKNKIETSQREVVNNKKEITGLKEEIKRLKKSMEFTEDEIHSLETFKEKHKLKPVAIQELKENAKKDSSEVESNNKFNVIVGAYKTLKDAKLGQKVLEREFNLTTFVLKNPESHFYFLATKKYDHFDGVNEEHQRLIELGVEKMVTGNIWVYKVQ